MRNWFKRDEFLKHFDR